MEIDFLLELAIILVSTKLLGVITKKYHLPQVVGALLAGLIMGPAVLGVLGDTSLIKSIAEIGVIVIMFKAGMEVDLNELKEAGFTAVLVALLGVTFPLIGGFLVASAFNMSFQPLLGNIFIGVILTATSVSITVETLQEMGKLKGKVGTIILGAAIIDDILGIIILTIITGFSVSTGGAGSIIFVVVKIIVFFLIAFCIGIPINKLFNSYSRMHKKKRRFPIFSFAFCLFLAYIGDKYFGVADIAGAFVAGLIISKTIHASYIERRFEILSYMYLSPIFFASIGLSIQIEAFTLNTLFFTITLIVVAVLTKVLGGYLGGKLTHNSDLDSLKMGVGMIARSEVALIVTNKGVTTGIIPPSMFAPIAILVIVTSIVTPILLKLVFTNKKEKKLV